MKLIVATSNKGKLREIREILGQLGYEVLAPPRTIEVEENGGTFLENAFLKAKAYSEEFNLPALADDSGLVVLALGGLPGIFSSRFYEHEFGGREEVLESKDEANLRKLLRLMEGVKDRRAKFVSCVVLYRDGAGLFAFGECEGFITSEPMGDGGFGYDPVFLPENSSKTMAQLTPEEKNALSHRGQALRKLVKLIENLKE